MEVKGGGLEGQGEKVTLALAPPRRTDIRLLIKPSMVSQGFLGGARCASSLETHGGRAAGGPWKFLLFTTSAEISDVTGAFCEARSHFNSSLSAISPRSAA